MVSYPVFMALVTMTSAVGLIIGLFVFADVRGLSKERMIRGVRHNWVYASILGLVLLAILLENLTHDFFYYDIMNEANFTGLIKDISFDGVIGLNLQRGLRSTFMDYFMIGIYFYFYTFTLFFTPFMFMIRDDRKRSREYALAIMLMFSVLLVFYFFFAVETPSMSGMVATEPIIYSNPTLLQFVRSVDPLDNAFPSGHVAIPFTAFFMLIPLRENRAYRRYAVFMGVIAFLIAVATLYLGAHWIADVVSAIILAWIMVRIARVPRVIKWFDGWAGGLRDMVDEKIEQRRRGNSGNDTETD